MFIRTGENTLRQHIINCQTESLCLLRKDYFRMMGSVRQSHRKLSFLFQKWVVSASKCSKHLETQSFPFATYWALFVHELLVFVHKIPSITVHKGNIVAFMAFIGTAVTTCKKPSRFSLSAVDAFSR